MAQDNKHFNTYKEGLDLEFLREYCMEHGERRTFLRGETLEEAGEPAQWVAFVERGCFKYMVHNDEEGRSATKETLATKGTQEGLLHGLRLRGRVRCRLPLLPRRRRVGSEHRGGHALRGARHQRTRAASTVRQRPEDDAPQRADTEEPIQDGLWARPRPLPLHRPQPLPSSDGPLSAGGADALAEGHRLVLASRW